jgi:transcriptional regulator with XRE-family HTH domain
MTLVAEETVGSVLRDWRRRRRVSQLDLAGEAQVSSRHLSFVESGRSAASRDVLLRLADGLDMPLRARNRLLLAAGYAPLYGQRAMEAPEMDAARAAVEAVLAAHAPFPALVVDGRWNLVAANAAVAPLMAGVADWLRQPPVNVLRASLHPQGLAPRIDNLGEWRRHVLHRLKAQAEASGDPALYDLHAELSALPSRASLAPPGRVNPIAIPLRMRDPATDATLNLISTTTVFGAANDVTLAELTLECFYPADEATRRALLEGATSVA